MEVSYTKEEEKLIESTKTQTNFNHETWSDEELKELRRRIKKHYIQKQNYTCAYCKQVFRTLNANYWVIEHIIPRAIVPQFMFEPQNLCVTCHDCNIAKSDKRITTSKAKIKYPSQSSQFEIIHPHFDIYEDHMLIVKEGFYYVAIKSKGEKTISICKLNRFYKYAGFSEEVDDNETIYLLSEQLRNSTSPEKVRALKKEIAFLAIRGS